MVGPGGVEWGGGLGVLGPAAHGLCFACNWAFGTYPGPPGFGDASTAVVRGSLVFLFFKLLLLLLLSFEFNS